MTAIDLKKTYRDHYTATDEPALVDVPPRPYLMIDGDGDPNTSEAYRNAVAALYPLAYGLRAAIKHSTGVAYTVLPLEGLWWVDDVTQLDHGDKSNWHWTSMICLPDDVTAEMAAEVLPAVTRAKKLVAGDLARVEMFGDGAAVQVLHRGPYADEGPTIARLHAHIEEHRYTFRGRHHEIYLSDPRRSDPARMRTILRQPIVR